MATISLTNTTRSTLIVSQRAYVFAAPGTIYHVDVGTGGLQGYVSVGNSGQTIARDVQRRVGLKVLPASQLPSLDDAIREDGKFVLPPDITNTVFRTIEGLTAETVRKIQSQSGDLRIYVFGKIEYKDVFEDKNTTVFCHMYYGTERYEDGYHGSQVKYCDGLNWAD